MLQCVHPPAHVQPTSLLPRWHGDAERVAKRSPIQVLAVATLECVIKGEWYLGKESVHQSERVFEHKKASCPTHVNRKYELYFFWGRNTVLPQLLEPRVVLLQRDWWWC